MIQRGKPDRIPADFRIGGQAMESVIAKLLQDFEQGKMNRRQLIQSLSLAAAAAAGMAPAARAASFHVKDPEGMGVQFGGLHQ
jgi:hypothetical protein